MPEHVREQLMMTMRLDEIGENCENLRASVTSYTFNKAERYRGGQTEPSVLLEVDNRNGSESLGDEWDDVDEV